MSSEPSHEHADPEQTVVLQDDNGEEGNGLRAVEQALAEAEAKAEESRNDYLRAIAELENFRKRAQRDMEGAHRFGLEKFAQEILPVKDSLELGLEAGEKAGGSTDIKALLAGKEATLQLLSRALEKFNVTEINPVGAPFDPQVHEAMAMQESATAEPNTVLQVVQKGYQLSGRLLRPARVIVAKPPEGTGAA